MDAPKHYHPNEVSQRKTNIISYHLYVESLKMIQMNSFTKETRLTDIENKHGYQRGNIDRGLN